MVQMVYAQTRICLGKMRHIKFFRFWYMNGSSNSSQMTRPYCSKQEEKNLLTSKFHCSSKSQSKSKKRKNREIPGPWKRTENVMEHEGDSDTNHR